ncbi:SDR family NAD(P)-dependent oxidoreductase [Lunatibacter salilacus]|uniref:SDR family NAD(P)-dependent oxidoreductase n=1 Tax=Lunatibacter salilacus TaxID=2483804 RepID=UPI00131ADDA9|nr:SDR family NAD(P)-dependent oxidoreductase [Lunatibacter salilacus]
MNEKTYTLITGASMGIGRAFALECASRDMNLILVALPDQVLEQVKNEILSENSVDVWIFGVDLTKEGGVFSLFNFCSEKAFRINMLINNAGMGAGGKFENLPLDKYLNIIDLNNKVLVQMTHYFLPVIKREKKGFILNMSSMEATLPLPYKAVYTASKSFVYAFSLAIREELASEGKVEVSVVCPGPVVTNPEALKRMKAHGARGKMVAQMPEQVAAMAIRNLLKGKRVTIPGKLNWALVKVGKMLPTNLKMNLLERLFRVYRDH